MSARRLFKTFVLEEACFRISTDRFDEAAAEIRRVRGIVEHYIATHPEFLTSLEPLAADAGAPEAILRMTEAAAAVGVGPMAAVAGTFAQCAGEAAAAAGSKDIIIDNGGDLYLDIDHNAVVGIYSGGSFGPDVLAFLVTPEETPLSICSSSSKFGHSFSLGNCNLATVAAKNASPADAAATHLANLVKKSSDLEGAVQSVAGIPGILGALAIYGDRIGAAGKLPRLIRSDPLSTAGHLTIHPRHRS